MIEQWQDIPGYEGCYQAGNQGNIRSVVRALPYAVLTGERKQKTILAQNINNKGRKHVCLSQHGVSRSFTVHKLVLLAWHGEPLEGQVAKHVDGNHTNNHLDNLQWRRIEAAVRPKGADAHNAKLTSEDVYAIRESREKQSYLAATYGVTAATISYIKAGKTWRHI